MHPKSRGTIRLADANPLSAPLIDPNYSKAAANLMEKTYNRVNNLYKDGVVAEQKRDEALTQWQAAKYNC